MKNINEFKNKFEALKKKHGFEENDFELEAERKKNTGMKVVLTGFDGMDEQISKKKKTAKIVADAMKEHGVALPGIPNIHESGLSDDEVEEKKKDFVLPEGKAVEKMRDEILKELPLDSKEEVQAVVPVTTNEKNAALVVKYKELLVEIISLPWWKRFGYLNRMILKQLV